MLVTMQVQLVRYGVVIGLFDSAACEHFDGHILSLHCQGGMGFVVAARHVELGQLYAIKFLLPDVLAHDEALERFLREARAAAQLKSEHVARVHDVGRMENGHAF